MIKPMSEGMSGSVFPGMGVGRGYGCRLAEPIYLLCHIPFTGPAVKGDQWAVMSDYATRSPADDDLEGHLWGTRDRTGARTGESAAVASVAVIGFGWETDGRLHVIGTVLGTAALELYGDTSHGPDVVPGLAELTAAVARFIDQKYGGQMAEFRAGCSRWEDRAKADPAVIPLDKGTGDGPDQLRADDDGMPRPEPTPPAGTETATPDPDHKPLDAAGVD